MDDTRERNPYAEMTQDDFDRILLDILKGETAQEILRIPGVAEILIEHYNNEVLDRWEQEQQG